MKVYRGLVVLAPAILALSLSGCFQMDMTVRLEGNERWTTTIDMIFDRDLLDMAGEMGGEAADLSEFESSLDDAVDQIVSEYGEQGVTATWATLDLEDADEIGYELTIQGQGYDLLNEAVFDGSAIVSTRQEGSRQVVDFTLNGLGAGLGSEAFGGDLGGQDPMQMAGVMDVTITFALEGSQVIQTNGAVSEDGRRVEWVNQPGPYTASIVPQRQIPDWLWWAVGTVCCVGLATAVVVAVIVAVVLIRRRKPKAV